MISKAIYDIYKCRGQIIDIKKRKREEELFEVTFDNGFFSFKFR
ncbi:MAG: hypothetical protein ABEK36_04670 [Candidatus Aenigmatarchaeota archaeon]